MVELVARIKNDTHRQIFIFFSQLSPWFLTMHFYAELSALQKTSYAFWSSEKTITPKMTPKIKKDVIERLNLKKSIYLEITPNIENMLMTLFVENFILSKKVHMHLERGAKRCAVICDKDRSLVVVFWFSQKILHARKIFIRLFLSRIFRSTKKGSCKNTLSWTVSELNANKHLFFNKN